MSTAWELESDYHELRALASLLIPITALLLTVINCYRIHKTRSRNNMDEPPKAYCKHFDILCNSICDRFTPFECRSLCVCPDTLDLLNMIFILGSIAFLLKAIADFFYGDWETAQRFTIGRNMLLVFTFSSVFMVVMIYLFYYRMLVGTFSVSMLVTISKYTRIYHICCMIIITLVFSSGNIIMETYKYDENIFRYGQLLCYFSVVLWIFGIFLIWITFVYKLMKLVAISMSTEIKKETDMSLAAQFESERKKWSDLINVSTKISIITMTIVLITICLGAVTFIRYQYPTPEIRLARYFFFTITLSLGAFCLFLTHRFHANCYEFACFCGKCDSCCLQQLTICALKTWVSRRLATKDKVRNAMEAAHEVSRTKLETKSVEKVNSYSAQTQQSSMQRPNMVPLSTMSVDQTNEKMGNENDMQQGDHDDESLDNEDVDNFIDILDDIEQ